MKVDPLKIFGVIALLAFIVAVGCFIRVWVMMSKDRAVVRQKIEAMTSLEKERFSYDLMAAMFNASQTNWTMTVTITPRTNR